MIFEIGRELQTAIRAQDCPLSVVVRDKKKPVAWIPERIVIEHDDDSGDSFSSPRSHREDPKHSFTRTIGVKATIFAKSPKADASEIEHRRRAETILDCVLAGMKQVSSDRKNAFLPKTGSFFVPPELADSDARSGAAYELKFTFDRGSPIRKWDGSAKPTASLARVTMSGAPSLTFAEVGATGDTITRSAGSWVTDGFTVGMKVSVRGTVLNNITGATIAGVSALVLTLGSTDLAAEGPILNCRVVAGGIRSSAWASFAGGVDDDDDYTTVPAAAEAVLTG